MMNLRSGAFRLLAAALLVVVATPVRGQSVSQPKRPSTTVLRARADSLARAFVAQEAAPAISVQLVRGRDTVLSAGYGLAELELRVPAGAGTVYRIGSITKQFTAALVMRLVEQKKVALDDSIAAYLPNLPAAWRGVTVRQLLNHTSGIPAYTGLGERWIRRWGEDMSPDTIMALTAAEPMWFAPGTSWRYDNSGYVLLGMLLERVGGKPYPDQVEDLVRSLGLQHTWYCDTRRIIPQRAAGYERDPDGWRNASYLSMAQPYSAGALCSTVGDVARWNALLSSGGVVSPASFSLMTTPQGAAERARYGFGLMLDSLGGRRVITHGGGINGFNAANAFIPADSISVTVLTNSGSSRPDGLLRDLASAALGLPLQPALKRVTLTPAQRLPYAGRYQIERPGRPALVMTVLAGRGALMAQPQGQPATELIPLGKDVFAPGFDPAARFTFTAENGRATGFTLLQAGRTLQATRVE